MSFREKSAWITLVSTFAIFAGYFVLVGSPVLKGGSDLTVFIGPLVGAVTLLIGLQILLAAATAVMDPKASRERPDERERMIGSQAGLAGFYTLQAGAFFAVTTALWRPDPAIIANAVLLAMAVAEIARSCFTVAGFHRAAS